MQGKGLMSKGDHLREYSSEELEALLRADIDSEDNDNDEMVFCILEELKRRREEGEGHSLPDVEQAWSRLQNEMSPQCGQTHKFSHTHLLSGLRKKGALVAVIICCLLFLFDVFVPPALGYQGFMEMVGQWTSKVFFFLPSSTSKTEEQLGDLPEGFFLKQPRDDYSSLHEALKDFGLETARIPRWIPERFAPDAVTVSIYPDAKKADFFEGYSCGEDFLSVLVTVREKTGTEQYQKDMDDAIIYTEHGTDFYLFENYDQVTAVWFIEQTEYSVSGDLTMSELREMIDSIYER